MTSWDSPPGQGPPPAREIVFHAGEVPQPTPDADPQLPPEPELPAAPVAPQPVAPDERPTPANPTPEGQLPEPVGPRSSRRRSEAAG